MTSSADLPEGFLAEVFRNGCQCDHCVKWRTEVARLREELRDYLLSDEAAEGNGYGCYSAGMREKLWALVGREGR